jgi:hypothetical protein
MIDKVHEYIYNYLYEHLTMELVVEYSSIILLLLIIWIFWGAEEPINRIRKFLVDRYGGNKS